MTPVFFCAIAVTPLEAQTFEWAKQAGGTRFTGGYGIALDGSANSYVVGDFSGTITFGTSTSLTSAGSGDVFVAKYDSAGNLAWAKSAGGTGNDVPGGIAVDGSGNSYVTGFFSGTATFGSITLTSAGTGDVFVAK